MKNRTKWLLKGGFGAALFGFGTCCTIESAFYKHSGADWYEWALAGTISLSILISGLVLLIQAGILGNELKKEE